MKAPCVWLLLLNACAACDAALVGPQDAGRDGAAIAERGVDRAHGDDGAGDRGVDGDAAGADQRARGDAGVTGDAAQDAAAPAGDAAPVGPRLATLQPAGPISATSGATYAGLRISNPNGPCITVSGQSNVTIVDCELGPCGGEAAIAIDGSQDVTVAHCEIHDSPRGVLVQSSTGVVTRRSRFDAINGVAPRGTAIEYDYVDGGGTIAGNLCLGSYGSDVISGFESSNLQIVDNEVQATITEPSAAGFTIGDSVGGQPGHDNYVARNRVQQQGGVPPGVFGSSGNTLLEHNCLPTGIQAYAYNGAPFVGVTVQYNFIGPGSFVPDPALVAGWSTNTFTADGSCPGM